MILIAFLIVAHLVIILVIAYIIMINEECAGNGGLVFHFCNLVKMLFPFLSLCNRSRIRGVGNYDTSADMANVERLESRLGSAPHALVPYLDPNLLAIDFHYFETKVIGVFTDRMQILFRILFINFNFWKTDFSISLGGRYLLIFVNVSGY